VSNYKHKWLQHFNKLDQSRITQALMNYQPAGTGTQETHSRDFWIAIRRPEQATRLTSLMMMMMMTTTTMTMTT